MNGPEVLIPIIISVSFFAMVAYVVAVIVGSRNRSRVEKIRSELQSRMLEKFGSAAEFIEFAKTPEGRRLLEGSTLERPITIDQSLAWIRRGILLSAIGIGFGVLTAIGVMDSDGGSFVTVLALAIGLGALGAAFASRKLGRSWMSDERAAQTDAI